MDSLLKGNVIPSAPSGGVACNQIPQDGLIASYLLQGTAEDEKATYNGTESSATYAYNDERGVVYNGGGSITIPSTGGTYCTYWVNTGSAWTHYSGATVPSSLTTNKYSNLHIYNRTLSAQEVTDIYNLEKYQHNNALDHGLIAYYPLDGNSLDNAINQYDGTDTSVSYVADTDMGVVADFNGSTSKSSLGSLGLVDGNVFAASFWIKPDDVISDTNIFTSYNTAIIKGSGFGLYNNTVYIVNAQSAGNLSSVTVPFSTTTEYTHIYGEITGANILKLYINAVLSGTLVTDAGVTTINYSGNFNIGANVNNIRYYNGKICKVRVYNRPLSPKEIDWLYAYEKPNSTELICNSTIDNPDPFEDGSGLCLIKCDGNVNDTTGVYNGAPTSITYAGGIFGQTAVFDGTTSKIVTSVANAKVASLYANCTNVSANRYLVDARTTSGTGYVYINTSGLIQFVGCTVKINGTSATSGVTTPTLGVNNHYEITFTSPETVFTIGATFLGKIEQVRFISRVTTVSENTILQNERKV